MKRSLLEILGNKPIRQPLDLPVPDDLPPIADAFSAAGEELYIVGGAVRDALLGKTPKDYDLATGADPDRVIKIVSQDPTHKIDLTGKSFGVVRVRTAAGEEYEIATFRKDIGEGRRPDSVEFTTIEADVKRRDLTINALFYDLSTGEAVDYVGGIADIEDGIVRAVGDPALRFREDKLRILRAVRFAARLGSDLDQGTVSAIMRDNDLSGVSPERIRDEFAKAVKSAKNGQHLLSLISELNLWPQIFPGLEVAASNPDSSKFDVQVALLLWGNDPYKVMKVLQQMKYTSDEVGMVRFLLSFPGIDAKTAPKLKKEFKRLRVPPAKLEEFALAVGAPEKLVQGFLEFVRRPPAAKPQDLMARGLKGPQIGQAMDAADADVFKSLTESFFRILSEQVGTTPEMTAFMKDYYASSHPNPLDNRERLWFFGGDDESFALVAVGLKPWDGAIHMGSITTKPPNRVGHGFATQVINFLMDLADKHGVPMTLSPKPFGHKAMNQTNLKAWYKRLGFRNTNYGRMRREAQ